MISSLFFLKKEPEHINKHVDTSLFNYADGCSLFDPNVEVDWENFYCIAYNVMLALSKSPLYALASIIYHFPLLLDEMPFKALHSKVITSQACKVLEKNNNCKESLKNNES